MGHVGRITAYPLSTESHSQMYLLMCVYDAVQKATGQRRKMNEIGKKLIKEKQRQKTNLRVNCSTCI